MQKSFEEATAKLENKKEEYEQFKLLLKEPKVETQHKELQKNIPNKENLRKKKKEIQEKAAVELKEIFEKRKLKNNSEKITKESKNKSTNKNVSKNHEEVVTIWDLSHQTGRTQIFEATQYLGRIIHIEIIREGHYKTRAKVTLLREKESNQDELP